MTPELKAQWVAALRSGNYKQGRSALCENNKYCCLGVLADLLGELKESDDTGCKCKGVQSGISYTTTALPEHLLNKVGLDRDVQHKLIVLNDGSPLHEETQVREHSFDEIADYIEENL